jgi:hypothetical protein
MARKSKTKSFKQHRKSDSDRGDQGNPDVTQYYVSDETIHESEGHPYKMTYHKSHTNGKGEITHHEFRHVTHHLEGKPQTPEGARGMVSRTKKHNELKAKGYKPHTVGEHDDKKTHSFGKPVKHVQDDD